MNKSDGNFWTGLLLGSVFLGKKKNDPKEKGGCLSTIFGIIILFVLFTIGMTYGVKGVVTALVICIIVIPGIIGFLMGSVKQTKQATQEAWGLYNKGSYTLALEKCEGLVSKNCDAAHLAGLLYFYGNGCDVNYEKAFNYFSLAKRGNAEAKTYHALMLLNGQGCEQNIKIGKQELAEAFLAKDSLAIMKMGEFELMGDFGFQKNVESAMKNLRIAIDTGFPYAKCLVGMMQYTGSDGVPQNIEKGLELLQQAAAEGVQEAKDFLAKINETN